MRYKRVCARGEAHPEAAAARFDHLGTYLSRQAAALSGLPHA